MFHMLRPFCLCLMVWAPLLAQLPICPGSAAAPEVNQGIKALNNHEFAQATQHFEAATQVDPSCANAWVYLGNAYVAQYVPGAVTPDNQALAEKAREQFQKALDQQPENQQAMEGIASLYFNQKKLDDAQAWYEKLTVINPDHKAAFYTMGVIAWTRSYKACAQARTAMDMKPEDPGPLKDLPVRESLRAKYLPIVQEGIDRLNRALEIDGEYVDAMAYLNLLYRLKADLENTSDEYQADIAKADEWIQKSLETRKEKATRQP